MTNIFTVTLYNEVFLKTTVDTREPLLHTLFPHHVRIRLHRNQSMLVCTKQSTGWCHLRYIQCMDCIRNSRFHKIDTHLLLFSHNTNNCVVPDFELTLLEFHRLPKMHLFAENHGSHWLVDFTVPCKCTFLLTYLYLTYYYCYYYYHYDYYFLMPTSAKCVGVNTEVKQM